MICQYVANLWWDYNLWLYFMMRAQLTSGKSSKQFKRFLLSSVSLEILHIMATWEAEGTSMIRGPKKKGFNSVADSYLKCWAGQFRIFGHQDAEIALIRIMEICIMHKVSYKHKQHKTKTKPPAYLRAARQLLEASRTDTPTGKMWHIQHRIMIDTVRVESPRRCCTFKTQKSACESTHI